MVGLSVLGALISLGWPGGPIEHLWRQPSNHELDALQSEGDAIVRSLDEYFANHHRYPFALPESLDTSRSLKYGGWRYECVAACTSFKLFVGHYRDYSFEIHWQQDKRSWYTDT